MSFEGGQKFTNRLINSQSTEMKVKIFLIEIINDALEKEAYVQRKTITFY